LLDSIVRGLHSGDWEVPRLLGLCNIPTAAPTANTQYATGPLLTYLPYSLKVGRVVIITRGRYAGKKCVIISPLDNGTKSHPFPHALVAGIERYPSKVTRRMSKTKQAKKSKVKPFVKQVNCMWD
jgi:hypothetical protein